MKKPIILVLLLVIIGCAAPQTLFPKATLEDVVAERKRQLDMAKKDYKKEKKSFASSGYKLYEIGYNILESGVSLCKDNIRNYVGIIVWDWSKLNKKHQIENEQTDNIKIDYIVPNSPADKVGLRNGDVVISLNNESSGNNVKKFNEKLQSILQKNNAVKVQIKHEGKSKTKVIFAKKICDYTLHLADSKEKNAYADGKKIVINKGMMSFFNTDEEAALVIAHELAHNSMGHIDAKKENTLLGGITGILLDIVGMYYGLNTQGVFTNLGISAGSGSYSVEFEQEADYVGMYFMALAGYEIKGVANFWRRMAKQNPKTIKLKSTHPTTPERFVAINLAVKEIKYKQKDGWQLIPEYKK